MRRRDKKNSGFTLVEVLVSVAILSLIMVALFSCMTILAKNYNRSNQEVNVQNDAQTLMMQLENFIVDAEVDVKYEDDTDTVYILNSKTFAVIKYDSANQKLYYKSSSTGYSTDSSATATLEADTTKNSASYRSAALAKAKAVEATWGELSDSNLLAEDISSFVVVTHIDSDNNYVSISMVLDNSVRSYTSNKNIYLRNQIVTPTVAAATGTAAQTSISMSDYLSSSDDAAAEEGSGEDGSSSDSTTSGGADTDATTAANDGGSYIKMASGDTLQVPSGATTLTLYATGYNYISNGHYVIGNDWILFEWNGSSSTVTINLGKVDEVKVYVYTNESTGLYYKFD